ncbi:hypothetical protein TrST_g1933 [Triparma strigata]|uniref:Cyclic nucleotide-binding domain-containing protein n=1 Tax=Triparma strigata TaxID=1606541 RepID=A0A9W7B592_9STRA|nr:hypothetical protein TrST_g1933 [Triparma strigata]
MFGGLSMNALRAAPDEAPGFQIPKPTNNTAPPASQSQSGDLVNYDLVNKVMNPNIVKALSAAEAASPSNLTVLVYDKNSSTRAPLIAALKKMVKRVIVADDLASAAAIINRNNSDPARTRNAVRLLICNLDVVSMRIIEFVQSRLTGEHGRMETIPVLLTVDDGTVAHVDSMASQSNLSIIKTHTDTLAEHSTLTGNPTVAAPITSNQQDMLTTALEDFGVVAGYISCNHTPAELERVITKLARKYAEVYTVYQDLRASVEEFTYPKYRGDFEGDDEEFLEEEEKKSASTGVTPAKPSMENKDAQLKAWAKAKAESPKNAKSPMGKGLFKNFSKHLVKDNKAHQTSNAIKALVGGSGFDFDQDKMKRKSESRKSARPKVGLSSENLRPEMFRRGGPKNLPSNTPKNSAGFHVFTPTAKAKSNRRGASARTPKAMISPYARTPGGKAFEDPHAVHLAPAMEPFVKKEKPELGSPRTSRGLPVSKVATLKSLTDAQKAAEWAKMRTGTLRVATADEKIRAMANKNVMEDIGLRKKETEEERAEKEESRRANLAEKLRERIQARRASLADSSASPSAAAPGNILKGLFTRSPNRPNSAPNRRGSAVKPVSMAEVLIAAVVKNKQETTLKSVLKEARAIPPDMLQYDLMEIKPGQASSLAATHFLRVGYQLQQAKNYKEAVRYFQKACNAEPYNSSARFCLGVAFDKVKDYFKSLAAFSKCVDIEEEKVKRSKTFKSFEDKLEEKKAKAAKMGKMGNSFVSGDGTESGGGGANAAAGSASNPHAITLPRVYFNRALVAVHLGDDTAALADLDTSLKLAPKDKICRGARAVIFRRMGRWLESQRDYIFVEKLKKEEEQKRIIQKRKMVAQSTTAAAATSATGTAKKSKRPSTAPAARRKGSVKSTNKSDKAEQQTPFERTEEENDPRNAFMKQVKKGLEDVEKVDRQNRREARPARLGGFASTIDKTPEASPTHKVGVNAIERSSNIGLNINMMNIEPNIELVESDDEDDEDESQAVRLSRQPSVLSEENPAEKTSHEEKEEAIDVFTPLPTKTRKNSFYEGDLSQPGSTTSRRSSMGRTPLATGRSQRSASFITKEDLAMNAPDLNAFKVQMGMDVELFDKLFSVPTDLQTSLCVVPDKRNVTDVARIQRVLADFEIMEDLDDDTLSVLARNVEYRTVAKSHVAYLQGEEADALCLCVSGTVSVRMTSDGGVVTEVCELGPGDWFGEYSLLMKGASQDCSYFDPKVWKERPEEDDGEEEGQEGAEGGGGKGKKSLRSKSAPLRETYFCTANCQFMLIMRSDFDAHLRNKCNEIQKEKFRILKRSKIFKGWKTDGIIRLARMARMKTIPRKEQIVVQGKECDSMHFIQKGICKVKKYPDRVALLIRDQHRLKSELETMRLKYSYHHTLHKLKRVGGGGGDEGGGGGGEEEKKKRRKERFVGVMAKAQKPLQGKGVFMGVDHVAQGEEAQVRTEKKLADISRLIQKYSKDDASMTKEPKVIETLVAPSFFGSESILDPKHSISMGTVVAYTAVHCLVVHKIMIQAFDIHLDFLKAVRERSTVYPDDLKLARDIEENRDWDDYKRKQLEGIKKTKWPVGKKSGTMIKTLPGGKSIVVKSMHKPGADIRM